MNKNDVRAYRARFAEMNRRMSELARRKVPKDHVEAQLKLGDLGWANSVSTTAWAANIGRYYDEMAAATSSMCTASSSSPTRSSSIPTQPAPPT
jgi:hypothetical protein